MKVSDAKMELAPKVTTKEWFSNLQNSNLSTNLDNKEFIDANIGDHKWQDLPLELLIRVLSLGDNRTVIIASGVCTGWRDAICIGVNKISLSWCKRNMAKLVQSIAPKFTHLQSLNLRQSQTQLNDQAVETVAKHCPDLLELDLSNSTKLTDASVYALARGCTQLQKLNISGCSGVSDSALIFLVEKCKKLRNLNLCGCASAGTDRALLALAHNCRGLQSLNLGWCEQVTDIGVTSLAFWCPELMAVDLCGCVLITGTWAEEELAANDLVEIILRTSQPLMQPFPVSWKTPIQGEEHIQGCIHKNTFSDAFYRLCGSAVVGCWAIAGQVVGSTLPNAWPFA